MTTTYDITEQQAILMLEALNAAAMLPAKHVQDVMECDAITARVRIRETIEQILGDDVTDHTIIRARRAVIEASLTHPIPENRTEYNRLNIQLAAMLAGAA
jgi:hypothetical protein